MVLGELYDAVVGIREFLGTPVEVLVCEFVEPNYGERCRPLSERIRQDALAGVELQLFSCTLRLGLLSLDFSGCANVGPVLDAAFVSGLPKRTPTRVGADAVRIVILGAGVQGTLYGVRLARAGHEVTLIARGTRAEELRERGAIIEDAMSARTDTVQLPITERLTPDTHADLCLVAIRREQINEVLPDLVAASAIGRFVFMVNHANGSEGMFKALGRARVVLAFPGAAGSIEGGVDRYIEVSEQPTAVETSARDVISIFRGAGFRVSRVQEMDAWLRRHAVFVTAVAGALYEAGGSAGRLAANPEGVSTFILAVREGWAALDRRCVKLAPLALRTIFCWVPLPFAILYWRRLLDSSRGKLYFARHARHARRRWRRLRLTSVSFWMMRPGLVSTGFTPLLIWRW
jgi:2-dehydropantoate 2-reductase